MKYVFIAGGVILVAFLIVLQYIPLGIEPLTELYFENHTKLPKFLFLDRSYNFSFTVHNLEYQDVNYEYRVYIENVTGGLITDIDGGEFVLTNNESKTIWKSFSFAKRFDNAKVIVVINKNRLGEPEFKKKLWWEDPNEADEIDIHFLVEEIRGPERIITPD